VESPAADRLDDDDPLRATELRAAMEPAIRDEIANALAAVQPTGSPSDILVLVPSKTSSSVTWARAALRRLASVASGVSYIDYTRDENRETLARPDQIRLCTFHSSRGIEARRVTVINFHEIAYLPAQVDLSLQNLGYIVLSRATERTTIMVPDGARNEALDFLEWVIAGVSQVVGHDEGATVSSSASSPALFRRGDRVNHQQLGVGRVIFVEETRLWIDFGSGKPQLLDADDGMLLAI
jgi:hypothetical protein